MYKNVKMDVKLSLFVGALIIYLGKNQENK
jgi:hypothetical protein